MKIHMYMYTVYGVDVLLVLSYVHDKLQQRDA